MLERVTLLKRQAVRLGDDRDNIDNLAELLHHNDIDRPEGVAGRVNEEQAAVDTRVLDMAVTLRGELLAEVRAVLVLDVLHDRVPAAQRTRDASESGLVRGRRRGREGKDWHVPVFVVDLVAVAGCVDDVEAELHTVLDNDCTRSEE